jgi:hypothetical protein
LSKGCNIQEFSVGGHIGQGRTNIAPPEVGYEGEAAGEVDGKRGGRGQPQLKLQVEAVRPQAAQAEGEAPGMRIHPRG